MLRINHRLRRPAAVSFGFGLSAALPAHQFLIHPPSSAAFLGLPMMANGELNLWGYAVGFMLTVGYACFGMALVLAIAIALRSLLKGRPLGNGRRGTASRPA